MDSIKLTVSDCERKIKILGLFSVPWLDKESTNCGPVTCKFDFNSRKVFKIQNHSHVEVGRISKFKRTLWHSPMNPFVGIIKFPSGFLETSLGMLGTEMSLNLEVADRKFSKKINYSTKDLIFTECISINMNQPKRHMIVETSEEYEDLAIILSSIIFKFTMDYLQIRGDA